MSKIKKILKITALLCLIGILIGSLTVAGFYFYLAPKLPEVSSLEDVQLQEPLRIYSREGLLISEYGDKRRMPLRIEDIPQQLQQAFVSSEDDRFYEHPGVDWQGLVRAVVVWVSTGSRSQGGSTITMQVARNFFLTREKSMLRKINEIFLALKITQQLSKDKVLELYLNKIYLGKRAYGVSAAAKVYYGKTVDELTLAEMAMIAGLPKAPSNYNPIARPERALQRRNYVLGRMLKLQAISKDAYELALLDPITAKVHAVTPEVEAHYVSEMARSEVARMFPGDAYTSGLKVYTTIDGAQQRAANQAIRQGLQRIDQRHGYRGALGKASIVFDDKDELDTDALNATLNDFPRKAGFRAAVVTQLAESNAQLYLGEDEQAELNFADMQWAQKHINTDQVGPTLNKPSDALNIGDVIWVQLNENGQFILAQVPEVESAMVAMSPNTGAITALVGGFDYFKSKFNRATQAQRQAGSSFKPFMYATALEKGYSAASIINDAPVVFDDPALESKWKPENYSGKFYGPTRLRVALANSRNLVSIRLLLELGVGPVRRFASRFGFDSEHLPRDLSLALGSGSTTPLGLTTAFAALANGGYKVSSHFISRIEDASGATIFAQPFAAACISCLAKAPIEAPLAEPAPATAPTEVGLSALPLPALEEGEGATVTAPLFNQAEQILESRTAFIIRSMLQDVVKRGTARRALRLGRTDLAGKTGTTNDQIDAWFSGFNDDIVASVWVGHDTLRTMGRRETGSSAALPIWVDFMEVALQDSKMSQRSLPPGMVSVRIDPASGLLAHPEQKNAIFEIFREENVPTKMAIPERRIPIDNTDSDLPARGPELLF